MLRKKCAQEVDQMTRHAADWQNGGDSRRSSFSGSLADLTFGQRMSSIRRKIVSSWRRRKRSLSPMEAGKRSNSEDNVSILGQRSGRSGGSAKRAKRLPEIPRDQQQAI